MMNDSRASDDATGASGGNRPVLGGDIKSPRLLYAKGALFVVLGLLSASLLLFHAPSVTVGVLLAVCVWSFCRAYYFAFYVIEHYVDGGQRYAGLIDFAKRMWRRAD